MLLLTLAVTFISHSLILDLSGSVHECITEEITRDHMFSGNFSVLTEDRLVNFEVFDLSPHKTDYFSFIYYSILFQLIDFKPT